MKMSNRKTILSTFAILALVAILMMCPMVARVHAAYTFPKSNKVAMVPSGICANGGNLYVGTSFPNGDTFTFTNVDPVTIANGAVADPIAAGGYDTVVLMTPNFNWVSMWADSDFSSRILSFVNGGGKLIIYDSEAANNYASFIYSFTVNSPGATGSSGGSIQNLVDETLSSNNTADASYINLQLIPSQTDAVGDSNVMTSQNSNWFIDIVTRNVNNVAGPVHTYAFYGAGIIIYNGLDIDYASAAPSNANGAGAIGMIWWRELTGPGSLSGGISVSGLTLTPATATNVIGNQHTVTALVTDTQLNPVSGKVVTFTILTGPNAGLTGQATTGTDGKATYSWTSSVVGTDTVQASILNAAGAPITATATKTWQTQSTPKGTRRTLPSFPS